MKGWARLQKGKGGHVGLFKKTTSDLWGGKKVGNFMRLIGDEGGEEDSIYFATWGEVVRRGEKYYVRGIQRVDKNEEQKGPGGECKKVIGCANKGKENRFFYPRLKDW